MSSDEMVDENSKVILTMPFNNDISFPVNVGHEETIGSLRRRIAERIRIDPSRIIISKIDTGLGSDVPVSRAGEKLQLVVRSSFDFELLRQLIEDDLYTPLQRHENASDTPPAATPPRTVPGTPVLQQAQEFQPFPSPLRSPDLRSRQALDSVLTRTASNGSGVTSGASRYPSARSGRPNPWYNMPRVPSDSVGRPFSFGGASPRRSNFNLQRPNVLRLKLSSNVTLELNASGEFSLDNNKLKISPDLEQKLKEAGVTLRPVSTRQLVNEILLREALNAQLWLNELRARNLYRSFFIFSLSCLVIIKSDPALRNYHEPVYVMFSMLMLGSIVHMFMALFNLRINWLALCDLPDIYRHNTNPENLIQFIPENADLSDPDKVVDAMRVRVSVFAQFKMFFISMVPSIWDQWSTRAKTQREAHKIAVRMLKERRERQAAEKAAHEAQLARRLQEESANTEKPPLDPEQGLETPSPTLHVERPPSLAEW